MGEIMADAQAPIPEITDEDIAWVCSTMDLDPFDEPRRAFLKQIQTVDLSACPGSGKTTLIVAKLAILARKWPYRTKGICVLSHTNVAGEQIQERLGQTVVGQRLLGYPHFIDTIHGFVNRFLALPWLYSLGYPVQIIDDDIALARRWFKIPQVTRSGLERSHQDRQLMRICDTDFGVGNVRWGNGGALARGTDTYQALVSACRQSIEEGFHCYDEMFVWANALLTARQEYSAWIAQRFPLILLDEMQDTSDQQSAFLTKVFPRISDDIVVQRVGDPNQAIFDRTDAQAGTVDLFPDAAQHIVIPNSYRFGQDIAALASPFAVHPILPNGLTGIGPKGGFIPAQERGHAIFLFPDGCTEGIIEEYGRHALSILGPELISKGRVTAVGHIHQDDPGVAPGHAHYPKSVGHYWGGYSAQISRKDPNPRTLAECVRVAQVQTADGKTLSLGVEKIAAGLLRLADEMGDIDDLKRKSRSHRAIEAALQHDPRALSAYRDVLIRTLIDRLFLTAAMWPLFTQRMVTVASALCRDEPDAARAQQFLEWPQDDLALAPLPGAPVSDSSANIYRLETDDGVVEIRLGSIHSVKGQTHLASLVLSTYWHDHSSHRMMPWTNGANVNGSRAGARDTQRLILSYVAMTRPTHLLCLAIPQSALGDNQNRATNLAAIRQRGWRIAEMVNGTAEWQD
jgi:DNA helicase-2/ATP-dependent DNA helicase PcrA